MQPEEIQSSHKPLFSSLSSRTIVVTPNRRLAAYLHHQYSLHQQLAGKKVWPTPDILPLTSWIIRSWQDWSEFDHNHQCILLNPFQEQLLWEKVITDSKFGDELLQIPGTARLAKEAWQLVNQWQLPPNELSAPETEDQLAFQTWSNQFQALCTDNHWIDGQGLSQLLCEQIRLGKVELPETMFLVGFEEFTPTVKVLVDALESQGTTTQAYNAQKTNTQVRRLALPDTESEIRTMALWCKQILETTPDTFIGCVIPNLNNIRAKVEQTFREVFIPESLFPNSQPVELPFNISAGQALSEFSIIAIALKTLGLCFGTFELNDFSSILRSPFIGEAEQEINCRTVFDKELRDYASPTLTLKSIIAIHKSLGEGKWQCENFIERLSSLKTFSKTIKQELLPSAWAELFSQRLAAMGWPGERVINSAEYQLLQRWHDLLKEFAALDLTVTPIKFAQAVAHLKQLAKQTIFQPQSPLSSIQILGTLEAAGLQFDHLWFMGLTDEAWPPAANPNPFIASHIQQRFDMPHASATRELKFAKTLLSRLSQSADHVILSHPQTSGDLSLQASPLIRDIAEISFDELDLPKINDYATTVFNSASIESFIDDKGPKIPKDEVVSGGTSIFKQQAACPFRAFVEIRLGAEGIGTSQVGLNALERGLLVHNSLERIWNALKNSERLCSISDSELRKLLQQNIEDAIEEILSDRIESLPKRFLNVERIRLETILWEWLQLEKQRQPFSVVATEQRRSASFAGFEIHMQVDRVDQLEDGRNILIDYKTGKPFIREWFGDRPEEPQLPLYCISHDKPVAGLLFGQVRIDDMQFKGITEQDDLVLDVPSIEEFEDEEIADTWALQMTAWKNVLETLAEQFRAGHAEVDPKDPIRTCQYCELHEVCRINAE